jgi:hypothetical protein
MSIKFFIPPVIVNAIEPLRPLHTKVRKFNPFRDQNVSPEGKQIVAEETLEQKGHEEHVQNESMKKEDAQLQMDRLIKKSNRRIISINAFTLIPFGLFRNTIEVEESRVIFIFKQPFTFQSHTLDISDISNIFIESAFLFASMRIVSKTFIQNDITIGYLNKKNAEKVRKIIEGLRSFAHAKIDTSNFEVDELVQKIEDINQVR